MKISLTSIEEYISGYVKGRMLLVLPSLKYTLNLVVLVCLLYSHSHIDLRPHSLSNFSSLSLFSCSLSLVTTRFFIA
ncbi:hypothetical protein CPB85DRAFT_1286318 [Mucidula mucida]|nr:hypothetical protein CPB85DRAFT_1286318 [Mucidula mucida]